MVVIARTPRGLFEIAGAVQYNFVDTVLPYRYRSYPRSRPVNLSAIDLRHLRYFVAVVEQGSFRAAALKLHISQPPLTRQIQQLEGAAQATLLIRKPRGAELTEAGRVFYREARNILMLMDRAITHTHLTASGQVGRVDVGIFGSAVFGAIPRITRAFQNRYPRAEVALYTMGRVELLQALRERRLTVGFNRFFQREPDLTWERVQTERINVALDRTHPLASERVLSLAKIASAPLVLYPRAPRPSYIDHVLTLFRRRNLVPKQVLEVDDVPTAVALVASGIGLSLVPDSARSLQLPNVLYVPLDKKDHAVVDLCVIHRTDDDSALLGRFLEVVRELAPNQPLARAGAHQASHQSQRRTGEKEEKSDDPS